MYEYMNCESYQKMSVCLDYGYRLHIHIKYVHIQEMYWMLET